MLGAFVSLVVGFVTLCIPSKILSESVITVET
jgi:hypothetical protein